MNDTVTEQEFVRIESSESAPAVWLEGWLPDGDFFPELTEARETYVRLRTAWRDAGERKLELQQRLETDEAQRRQDLRDAYLAGETDPQLAPPDEDLKAELAAATEQSRAAASAYVEHLNRCIALVLAHRQEWLGEITAFEETVDSQIRALAAQVATLRAKRGSYGRLEHWIQRVAEGASFPAAHFPYSEIPAPLSGDPVEEEARDLDTRLRSYAGGFASDTLISDEQGRELERGNEASLRQPPSEAEDDGGAVELSNLDDEDLVDWLMSTGQFDGQTKPGAALVVKAADDDPDMAVRLMQAERTAGGDAPRPDVLEALTKITNRKAATA
jgi:hypothetical protein